MKDIITDRILQLLDKDEIIISNLPCDFKYYESFLDIPVYICDDMFIRDRRCLGSIFTSLKGVCKSTIIVIPSTYITKLSRYEESLSSVILHEIGHNRLGHLGRRSKTISITRREIEADIFSINFGGRFRDHTQRNIKIIQYFNEHYVGYVNHKEIPGVIQYIVYQLNGSRKKFISKNLLLRMEEIHLRIERYKQQP